MSDRELFSVLHLLTGKAAPSTPSLGETGRPSLAAFNTPPPLSPHCLAGVSSPPFPHTPYCRLSSLPLPPLPPPCLPLLTHTASQLMVPDSCYVQSELSRADAGRRGASKGAGTGDTGGGLDIGTTRRSMGMISDTQSHI